MCLAFIEDKRLFLAFIEEQQLFLAFIEGRHTSFVFHIRTSEDLQIKLTLGNTYGVL